MHVAIAGAHGQVARQLTRLLAARGDTVRGLIRNPSHEDDVRADGGEPVLCDIESASAGEVTEAIGDADAVVFAAGAGPGSGAARKWTVDRDGAVKLLEAARARGVGRYVIVSSIGAESPPEGDEVFAVYLQAKAQADRAVMDSGLDWTVVRPGALTDDPPDGRVRLDEEPHRGRIARADVAAVLAAVLDDARTVGGVLYANGGERSIEEALAALG